MLILLSQKNNVYKLNFKCYNKIEVRIMTITYCGKDFPSRKACIKYLDLTYSKFLYLSYKNELSLEDSITALLIEKLHNVNLKEIINNKLFIDESYKKEISDYVNSLDIPIIEKKAYRLNIPFYYDGIFYSSVREYCKKNNVKYMRLMQYKLRHNCSIETAIERLAKIDKEKDYKSILDKFHITEYSYKKLENKYGDKFYYYLNMLIKNNMQDNFKIISLNLFIDLAIKKNIKEKDIPALFEFIKQNKLKRKVLYRENLYSYNGVYDTSLHVLCDKVGVCFSTVRKRLDTMSYQDAIKYAMKNTRMYKYNNKTYRGFSNLCKDYNVPLDKAMKISSLKNISKMDAFLMLVDKKM